MNLVKKGTILLSALCTFALASCAQKSSTSFLKAREFLKDADRTVAANKKVDFEQFEWDLKVSGTGMEYQTGSNKLGGAQLVMIMLVFRNDQKPLDLTLLKKLIASNEFQSLKGSFKDDYRKNKTADDIETAFMDKDNFLDDIENMDSSYDHEYSIDGELMHASFKREEKLSLPGLSSAQMPVLNFSEEIIYKKDGFSDHWGITCDNMPLKVTYTDTQLGTGIDVDADGTINGKINVTFNLVNI